MNKYLLRTIVCTLTSIMLFAFAIPVSAATTVANANADAILTKSEILNELALLMDYIDAKYVGESVTKEQLREGMLLGLTSVLDDYSEYFSNDDFSAYVDSINGSFVGVGVSLIQDGDYVTISTVLEDSPALKAGVREGDKITAIDGKSIAKKEYSDVASSIRGEENTKVTLTVLRSGKEIVIPIIRAHIIDVGVVVTPISQVLASADGYDSKIGYLRLKTFGLDTYKEFNDAITSLKESGIKVLILDLRNNTGGFLDSCLQIARTIIPKGTLFSTLEKSGASRTYTSFLSEAPFDIVALVNENTASCAEILASAIKDSKAGILVGQTTYGKGVGQSSLALTNGGEIKLTTMEWLTRNGEKINHKGIVPNIKVTLQATEDESDAVLKTGFSEALKRIGKRK